MFLPIMRAIFYAYLPYTIKKLDAHLQQSSARIRQMRQLPLIFSKNCVRIRQTCFSRAECLSFSHFHLKAKHQNTDKQPTQNGTAILTSKPSFKRAVDAALLQHNQRKRRRMCPQAPAPFAFKEIH